MIEPGSWLPTVATVSAFRPRSRADTAWACWPGRTLPEGLAPLRDVVSRFGPSRNEVSAAGVSTRRERRTRCRYARSQGGCAAGTGTFGVRVYPLTINTTHTRSGRQGSRQRTPIPTKGAVDGYA